MSVVKVKFAGFLRNLLNRFDDDKPVAPKTSRPAAATPPVLVSPPAVSRQPEPSHHDFAAPPAGSAGPVEIQLPVTPILTGLPLDLRAKIVGSNTTGMMISLPMEQVLAQLATGSVKISFGELRQLAPGVFSNFGGECDAKPVILPLNLILVQLSPALLSRRAAQKQTTQVSDDVISPFNANGTGLSISTQQMKAPPAEPSAPATFSRRTPISQTPQSPPQRPGVQPQPGSAPRWAMPQTSGNGNGHGPAAPHIPVISAAPVPPVTATTTPPMAVLPEQSQPTISASLGELAENWPESLRLEIQQADLGGESVALPIHLVEPALKRGRVVFSWRCLRSWIKSGSAPVSVHDSLDLELPLKVLAPLFFSQKNGGVKSQRQTTVSKEIPNLFFGFPQPETIQTPEPAASPAPAIPMPSAPAVPFPAPLPQPGVVPLALASQDSLPDTNFFTRATQPQTTDSEFRRKGGTDFMSRAATPSEIVFRAMELPAVAGVIIALPDGLKVASQIPPDLNGDTLAAFIPQIFARVNQCSRELRMGDMNNLSFTVGNVPWKIFRVNAVYFAAFGRANETLPSVQLAALAVELDRKKI